MACTIIKGMTLFPACAGVIPAVTSLKGSLKAFPRVCGGDPLTSFVSALFGDFSPRVRG